MMESKGYKDATIKDIKEHLQYLLDYDYSKLTGLTLMTIEHILYQKFIMELERLEEDRARDFIVGDKVRIKTEAEFIEEFGDGWKFEVGWNYQDEMDHLFGVVVEVEGDLLHRDIVQVGDYYISLNTMVVPVEEE